MESVLSESDGWKEKFDVSSCVERVCAVLRVSGGYGFFVLDLKDHADAGADPVVNLLDPPRRAGFKRKNPNVLLQNFGYLCFSARDGVMYVFQGLYSVAHRETYSSSSDEQQRELLCVYRLKLTKDVSKWRNRAIDKSEVGNGKSVVLFSGRMHSPKLVPAAVQWCRYICVFSTIITYAGFSNIEAFDFELYEPDLCISISLPQLRVARRACDGSLEPFQFLLLNDACEEQVLVPRYQCLTAAAEVARASFCITAFSVINHATLVVQTDIGVLFSLNLDLPWQWKVFEGLSTFPHFHHNLVMGDNELVLSPLGASRYGGVAAVPFPLSSYVMSNLWRNFAIGLSERSMYPRCAASILQVGQGQSEVNYWTLDVLIIDLSKVKFNEKEKEKEKEKESESESESKESESESESESANENQRQRQRQRQRKRKMKRKMKMDRRKRKMERKKKEFGDQFAWRIKSFKFISGSHGSQLIPHCVYPF